MVERFNKNIKSQHLELDLLEKNLYERKKLIDNKNKNLKFRWKQSVWFWYDKTTTTRCIKQNLDISWMTFNLLLQNVSLSDQKLVTFMWLILNLIMLRIQKNK